MNHILISIPADALCWLLWLSITVVAGGIVTAGFLRIFGSLASLGFAMVCGHQLFILGSK